MTPALDESRKVRRYHKALLIVVACSLVLSGGLLRAVLQAPRPFTSAEVLAATRRAVDLAVDVAVDRGGLANAETFLRSAIARELHRQGFGGANVNLRRSNDLNPFAAFYFFVEADDLSVRFDLEGTRDPLAAMRLGDVGILRADPNHPYESHRERSVLDACLAHRYYHIAPEGPDFFARLENRTRDPYHFGFEALLTNGWALAADHVFFEEGSWGLDDLRQRRYGL